MNTSGNGHYVVDGKIYTSKILAILEAQRTGHEISWHFHQDVFSKVNWQVEPELSLQELYRIRAQQIRDKYDYVIVRVSGGADSTNVIRSFLNNGIHVDEIVTDIPFSGLNNFNWNDKDTSAGNTFSEMKYVTLPLLEEIRNKHPRTLITINDIFEDAVDISADKWTENWSEFISPIERGVLNKYPRLQNMAEQGKRIGVVWGVDKPQLRYSTDFSAVTVAIVDRVVNIGSKDPFDRPYPNVDRVLFYYTPELPELMVKQCHVICKTIHKKENWWIANILREISMPRPLPTGVHDLGFPASPLLVKGAYQKAIAPIIYPDTWLGNVFQCEKADGTFMPAMDDWFFSQHRNTPMYDRVKSEFQSFYKQIDPKYLDPAKNAFAIFAQRYVIGPVNKWTTN